MSSLVFETDMGRWRVDLSAPKDISLPLAFDGVQPRFFGAAVASARPFVSGAFEGDVRRGASCNCSTYTLTAHCNGTHTECVGHITHEPVSIRDVTTHSLLLAQLLTLEPASIDGDRVITADGLQAAAGTITQFASAAVIRTLPNTTEKYTHDYDAIPAAYFSPEAVHWLVQNGIEHLVTDLPSLDRGDDGGKLAAHRMFWGMPANATSIVQATRSHATVTELAFVPNSLADGLYLLNLQVAPFVADAAPSRPVLYPLERIE
jgi:kynurenine formamidase